MAYDIVLGITPKNWARGRSSLPPTLDASDPTPLSEDEKTMLDELARVRMRAEAGDKKATAQWKKLLRRNAALRVKAKRGDPKAKRVLQVLKDSRIMDSQVQKLSVDESMSWLSGARPVQTGAFVGDERRAQAEDVGEDLSHDEYRALIVRKALKDSKGAPSTRHFFAAKTSIDRALGNSGTSILIPGARPSRRTV